MTLVLVNQILWDLHHDGLANQPITLTADREDCLRLARIPLAAAAPYPSHDLGGGETVCWLYVGPTQTLYKVGSLALGSQVRGGGATVIQSILRGTGPTEAAPHGRGNIYAPEVFREGGLWRMWYGGLGRDGHDRIHLAVSRDGLRWTRRGVVLEDPASNHVNDPSVVRVGRALFMFYTLAAVGQIDRIDVAISANGTHWDTQGPVLTPGASGEWDSLLVGRPAVIHEDGVWRMWYDGQSPAIPGRGVGYATSPDGFHWTKHPGNPVLGGGVGAIDVKRVWGMLVMVYESTAGTMAATSMDGIAWTDRGLWLPVSGRPLDRAGHVTPMLLTGPRGGLSAVYVGAAADASWTVNSIARIPVTPQMVRRLL